MRNRHEMIEQRVLQESEQLVQNSLSEGNEMGKESDVLKEYFSRLIRHHPHSDYIKKKMANLEEDDSFLILLSILMSANVDSSKRALELEAQLGVQSEKINQVLEQLRVQKSFLENLKNYLIKTLRPVHQHAKENLRVDKDLDQSSDLTWWRRFNSWFEGN